MSESPGILAQLPADLHYLIYPAMRYGRHQFDDAIFDFLAHATTDEMDELAALAERVLLNNDYPRVNSFLDDHPITDSEEAARLYFMFGVMDYAELQFDRLPDGAP